MSYLRNIRIAALIFLVVFGWCAPTWAFADVESGVLPKPVKIDQHISSDIQITLMRLAFPDARYTATSTYVPIFDGRKNAPAWLIEANPNVNAANGDPIPGRLISILTLFRTGAGDVVLVTAEVPSDADGGPSVSHASDALIGVAIFHSINGGWSLKAQQEKVTHAGFFGAVQSTSIARVSSSAYAVSLMSSSCWQGICGSWLSIVGITEDEIAPWIEGLRLSADDLNFEVTWNQDLGCDDMLNHLGKHGKTGLVFSSLKRGEPIPVLNLPNDRRSCFFVSGQPAFEPSYSTSTRKYADLKIAFQGKWSVVDTDTLTSTKPRYLKNIATYRLQGGKYRLVSGYDPVPMF